MDHHGIEGIPVELSLLITEVLEARESGHFRFIFGALDVETRSEATSERGERVKKRREASERSATNKIMDSRVNLVRVEEERRLRGFG